mmetsp:Transcript_6209/g.9642  ORF Transcript_6209/g.9642 Transcript_6209/m.9642 type:complete len:228 (+) Transcript_6209:179-862(+)
MLLVNGLGCAVELRTSQVAEAQQHSLQAGLVLLTRGRLHLVRAGVPRSGSLQLLQLASGLLELPGLLVWLAAALFSVLPDVVVLHRVNHIRPVLVAPGRVGRDDAAGLLVALLLLLQELRESGVVVPAKARHVHLHQQGDRHCEKDAEPNLSRSVDARHNPVECSVEVGRHPQQRCEDEERDDRPQNEHKVDNGECGHVEHDGQAGQQHKADEHHSGEHSLTTDKAV